MKPLTTTKTLQDGIFFVNQLFEDTYQSQDLTKTRLKALFSEFIPNHIYIFEALTRSSGRPKKGAWTKSQAIGYYQELISSARQKPLNGEEIILCAILLRYQKSRQGNAVQEYWAHKLMVQFMADNPQYESPASAAHALAKKLNSGKETSDLWRKIDLYRSYMRVEEKTIQVIQ